MFILSFRFLSAKLLPFPHPRNSLYALIASHKFVTVTFWAYKKSVTAGHYALRLRLLSIVDMLFYVIDKTEEAVPAYGAEAFMVRIT